MISTFKSIPLSDWYISLVAISIIFIFLLTVEIGVKYFNFSFLYTRKFIHIITGLIICFISYFLYSNFPIIIFSTLYIFIDLWALRTGKFKSIHPDSRSYGTIFYAISVIILAILFWNDNKPLFIITNLIMIVPDALASIIGERYAKRYLVPVNEKKSLLGALTMFILTILIVFSSLSYFYNNSPEINIIIALFIGSIATISELLSIRGSDNLSVPLFSGLFLYAMLSGVPSSIISFIVIGILSAALVAILSYRFRFLNAGGSMLLFLMGSIIFSFGGWAYTFPILVFFILSSILSKFGKAKKNQLEASYQKSGVRDFYQTLANGGVATAIVLIAYFTRNESIYYIYIASLATATADTWGTELGIFSKSKPILITSLKPVPPGTSGAISPLGSISAIFGSFFIVLTGYIFYNITSYLIIIISLIGFSGSLMDSILGATIQGKFKCSTCNIITESKVHCNSTTMLQRGHSQVDNDLVNVFSIIFSAILTLIILSKEIF
jgi:uncharacterized protein (TIGR00297 family)